jgi:1-acyl-sn-glycerol-3-phosphate acyltransferase
MRALLAPTGSDLVFRGFEFGFNRWRDRCLRLTPVINLPATLPRDRPLVIVANHTSWWDGFLLRDIHIALRAGAPMHTVATAREMQRHPFLHWLGAVPLADGTAGVRAMLRELQRRARLRPDSTIVYFPQGSIWPAWRRPLGFRRGIETVLRALGPCYVLPVGIHVESLNHSAPTVFRIGSGVLRTAADHVTAPRLEELVTAGLDTVQALLAKHGEAAPATISNALERAWNR